MNRTYFEDVVDALRLSPVVKTRGFTAPDIDWFGNGRDHADLMLITRPAWTIETVEGTSEGYVGVTVHYESRRPGDFRLDCELAPRLGSVEKADQHAVAPLLNLKGAITSELRALMRRHAWPDSIGAHTRTVRYAPAHPRGMMVMAFELDLPEDHAPRDLVRAIEPIIDRTAPVIDQLLVEQPEPTRGRGIARALAGCRCGDAGWWEDWVGRETAAGSISVH